MLVGTNSENDKNNLAYGDGDREGDLVVMLLTILGQRLY